MQHITKLCADNLRTISNNHGVKLKSSHAHELVAAFFGYKSRAALLADTSHPLSNLRQASIIMLFPTDSIEQRRLDLQDLPLNLPDTYTLTEWIYTPLLTEKLIVSNIWSHHEQLAKFFADKYLRQNQMNKSYYNPIREGVTLEVVDNYMRLNVKRFYQMPIENPFEGMVYEANIITTTIILNRIAAHIGYANPEISAQIERIPFNYQRTYLAMGLNS